MVFFWKKAGLKIDWCKKAGIFARNFPPDQVNALSQAGYRVFTSVEGLRAYMEKLVRVAEEAV